MRILHVNKFFDLHGGAEVYMHGLIKQQQAMGHEVHAFSTRSDKNLPSSDSRHFVTRYNLQRSDGAKTDLQKAMNYVWNVEAQHAMERTIADIKPDVIHLHNLYNHLSTSVLAPIRRSGIPCVQTLHDYKIAGCPAYTMFTEGAPCERCRGGDYLNAVRHHCISTSFLPNLLAALEMGMVKSRRSYERTVRLFLCPSRFMQEKMEDWGQPKSKLRYVPNPTDFPEQAAPADGTYVLYVGALSQIKGVASLIEAFAKVPELPLKLAGRGPEEERLRSLARATGATNVEFLGFCPPAELSLIRRRAGAVALSTLSYENASGALLEAMADGLPCLATRIGGNPELVQDDVNGFLVHPGDVSDWVRALRRFQALSLDARRAMGEAGRQKIRDNHLWRSHVAHVMRCYGEAGATIS